MLQDTHRHINIIVPTYSRCTNIRQTHTLHAQIYTNILRSKHYIHTYVYRRINTLIQTYMQKVGLHTYIQGLSEDCGGPMPQHISGSPGNSKSIKLLLI